MRNRRSERVGRIGVGDSRSIGRIGERRKPGKLIPSAFAHRFGKLRSMIGKEQEGRSAGGLFAHEEQRHLWAQDLQCYGGFQRGWFHQRGQALAECAVADLVVILQEQHEGGWRQVRAGHAAGLAGILRLSPW